MRRVLLIVVLAAVTGLAFLLAGLESENRRGRHDAAQQPDGRAAATRAEGPGQQQTSSGARTAAARERPPSMAAPRFAVAGTLVYDDGAPAAGIELHFAAGRAIRTRQYRNGDLPAKVVWLLTRHVRVRTGAAGQFAFPDLYGPSGARAVVFTAPGARAHLLQEVFGGETRFVAGRCVQVTGTLAGTDGRPLAVDWVRIQREEPEDWDTRRSKEPDTFVDAAAGELGIGTEQRIDVEVGAHGDFAAMVLPGRSYLVTPAAPREPVLIDIAARDTDLGRIRMREARPARPFERCSLHGIVFDMAGRRRPDTRIDVWDETVGETFRTCYSDEAGRFRMDGLGGRRAIAWARFETRAAYTVIPEQCSQVVRLPCETPLALRLPAPEEFLWLRARPDGYLLLERNGVLVGGGVLDPARPVGLAPGAYRLVLLTPNGRILEARRVVRKGGDAELTLSDLRDTTWAVD